MRNELSVKEQAAIVAYLVVGAVATALYVTGKIDGEQLGYVLAALGFPAGVIMLAKRLRKGPPPDPGAALVLLELALATACVGAALVGCAAFLSKPAEYERDLIECNHMASTLADSIECENRARAARGRALRAMPDGSARDADAGDAGRDGS